MRVQRLCGWFLLIVLLGLALAGGVGAAGQRELFEAMGVLAPRRRTPAPEFALPALSGGTLRLADLRGRVVLVNFWATWCPPCIAEMPSLEKLRQRFRGHPFEVVAISIDRQGEGVVRPFVRRLGITFPVLLDPEQKTFRRLRGRGLPVSLLISRKGELVGRVPGPREWASPEATALIETLLRPRQAARAGAR
ncbi:MAG: TlpA disulfide reductase family protein [Nitrospinota bacterium]